MRTTLDIDEDVLEAAKELAKARRTTAGQVLSELARSALEPVDGDVELRNGVPILKPRPGERSVTLETVNRLRDRDGA
jgi:hypothetical protein